MKYSISLTKDTFLLYEPVFAEIWIKNINSNEVKVQTYSKWEDWVVKDLKGKVYPLPVSRLLAVSSEKIIPAGDSMGGRVDLLVYGIDSQLYPFGVFPVGDYRVQYQVDTNSTGSLAFTVVEPSGKEAEALKLYSEAYTSTRRGVPTNKSRFVEEVQRLELVADRFPNSVYAPAALDRAINVAWNILTDGDLYYRIVMRKMREYGDPSLTGIDDLNFYYKYVKGDMGRFKVQVDSIARTTANPKLSAVAKSALKRLEIEK